MEKILIVDDQYGIRILLSEILKNKGYEVLQASNGKQALEQKDKAELILLDLRMPGMHGAEVYQHLKEKKVIVMSAYIEEYTKHKLELEGIYEFIEKPFDIDKLLDLIKQALFKQTQLFK